VQSATIVNYSITAELITLPGPDPTLVLEEAQAAIEAYVADNRIGRDITLSGIYAALHRPGVERVNLTAPVANVEIDDDEAGFCTAINLTLA
jgi:phage-related baseplate assembly protein